MGNIIRDIEEFYEDNTSILLSFQRFVPPNGMINGFWKESHLDFSNEEAADDFYELIKYNRDYKYIRKWVSVPLKEK